MEGTMTVLVLGAFDTLHGGQTEFLARASQFGSVVVGLTSDDLLRATKREPIFTFDERQAALKRRGYQVVERGDPSARSLFLDLAPAFFVCGNDWLEAGHLQAADVDREFLDQYDITVVYTPRYGMSTTEIIRRVREAV